MGKPRAKMKTRKKASMISRGRKSVPAVAKLVLEREGGRGELRALGGGGHDEWNQRLSAQLAGSLPEAGGLITAATIERSVGAMTGQIGIDPRDPVEGMLGAQMQPPTPPRSTFTGEHGFRARASR